MECLGLTFFELREIIDEITDDSDYLPKIKGKIIRDYDTIIIDYKSNLEFIEELERYNDNWFNIEIKNNKAIIKIKWFLD